jgi:hypothetical protein
MIADILALRPGERLISAILALVSGECLSPVWAADILARVSAECP